MSLSMTKTKIREFINTHPLAVLSTVGLDGYPCGAVVYVACSADFTLYFLTKTETDKSRAIDENDSVALTLVQEETQETTQITAKVARISDPREIDTAYDLLRALPKETHSRLPITKVDAGAYVTYRVVPQWARLSLYETSSLAGGFSGYEYHIDQDPYRAS